MAAFVIGGTQTGRTRTASPNFEEVERKHQQEEAPPPVQVGYNTRTKKLGTIVGPVPIYVVPFKNMSKRQRQMAVAQIVPVGIETMAYMQAFPNNPDIRFFWCWVKEAVEKGNFNPLELSALRDRINQDRLQLDTKIANAKKLREAKARARRNLILKKARRR